MLSLAFFLLVIAVIAGILGFGVASAVNHIAKFLFYVIVLFLLMLLIYLYASFHATKEPIPPVTETPATKAEGIAS